MKYIDADKLIAEIEKRKQIHKNNIENGFPDEAYKITEDDNILFLIRSLQQEQQDNLEEEVKKYWNAHALDYRIGRVADIDFLHLTARHFAEWQKEKDTRDMYMSDNRHFQKVYELGKKDMKQEMMEMAVGGRYMKAASSVYVESWPLDIEPDSVKAGDEVRLIVILEEK